MNYVIFGNTSFSLMIAEMIKKENIHTVLAFTIDDEYINSSTIGQYNLIPFSKLDEVFNKEVFFIINTVGYSKMGFLKAKIQDRLNELGYNSSGWISKHSLIYSDHVDRDNLILPGAFIGPNVVMDKYNVVYSGANLTHDISIGNFNFIAAGTTIGGNIKIGDNCFLGLNCTLKNGIKLGNRVLIGAAAYVDKNLENESVLVPSKSSLLDKISLDLL